MSGALETSGLHHVSVVAGDPHDNRAFYRDTLGLRLTKRTVNHDKPHVSHLYYGDRVGTPGTSFTTFPYPLDPSGRVGAGQPGETAFAVPEGSLEYWTDRLTDHGVETEEETRFGERVRKFEDPDGLPLSLVESEAAGRLGTDGLEADTTALAREPTPGTVVDLWDRQEPWGKEGAGTGHHLALRVADREELDAWYDQLVDAGLSPSRPRERYYLDSVYVRDPGGVLFELATDAPGLTRDESVEELGSDLRLPPWLEADEETIRQQLPPLDEPVEETTTATAGRE